MSYSAARNEQVREGIVRFGVVTAVDTGRARAKVSFGGESESDWLAWMAERAAEISVWAPVSIGEQVVILSESGDTAQGVILGSVFSSNNPGPGTNEATHRVKIAGSSITITADAITLACNGSTVVIDADGVSINGVRIDLN
ncbi:putative baseplate assembly protein V [Phaeobacter inhibens]|uniref:Baseplate assembly protein V n=1 Tax=Phaeobacter piscinae TaxID=1580596 RepID=A0ABN5DEX5_9RHOB|nr:MULTISPECIES: phage baseplate assembly protein V [Phaeobacter]ATG35902.1 putative baseplate assembly protein V [Phaeobacter piscinae]AUQ54510.1 putative baseplate assembly protein V [Phaeobacter inhibens]AUQ78526.1 putative baseplate assembly protein V [Phaeobacter inhibens]AUQ86423.1 putative baseplate assembly protein V [Phaeobacter piscinae]AUR03864.1 putative baseplate assembly protein V [Phaeobacter inhibens]